MDIFFIFGKLYLTEMESEDVILAQVHKSVATYTSGKPQCFPFKYLNHWHSGKEKKDKIFSHSNDIRQHKKDPLCFQKK